MELRCIELYVSPKLLWIADLKSFDVINQVSSKHEIKEISKDGY